MTLTRRQALIATGSALLLPQIVKARRGKGGINVGQPFDFYISPTGSDTNAGTLAAPWAITAINTKQATYAGKRVGLIAGTYDVSSMMSATFHTPALNVNGGTGGTTTYIGSSDASGFESPRAATLDAKGASGIFGGGNTKISSIMGQGIEVNRPPNWGNWTIDGLVFTGFSLWAVHVGNYDGGGGTVPNATVQNCEFTGGSAQTSTAANGVNLAPLVVYAARNYLITNNYIHDNFGWTDNIHFSAVYVWGLGGSLDPTFGGVFTYNTLKNSGGIHGKNGNMYGTTIRYNHIDSSTQTPSGGYQMCIQGFEGANGTGGTTPTSVDHNVLVSAGQAADLTAEENDFGWQQAIEYFNNTHVIVGSDSIAAVGVRLWMDTSGSKLGQLYNNLFWDGGFAGYTEYGNVSSSIGSFAVCDYNIYNHAKFSTVPNGQFNSAPGLVNYATLASWATAITTNGGGNTMEGNSSVSTTNPFTSGGTFAKQYQVQSGSPAFGTGKIGGVPGGASCNVGAWDGTVTKIGCDFAV